VPRTLGRPLVSPNEQRFPPKLFKDGRRRHLHPSKSRRPSNHASSLFARQSRLRNRLRTEPSPRLGRHPRPRHQAHLEIGLSDSKTTEFWLELFNERFPADELLPADIHLLLGLSCIRSSHGAVTKTWLATFPLLARKSIQSPIVFDSLSEAGLRARRKCFGFGIASIAFTALYLLIGT